MISEKKVIRSYEKKNITLKLVTIIVYLLVLVILFVQPILQKEINYHQGFNLENCNLKDVYIKFEYKFVKLKKKNVKYR